MSWLRSLFRRSPKLTPHQRGAKTRRANRSAWVWKHVADIRKSMEAA